MARRRTFDLYSRWKWRYDQLARATSLSSPLDLLAREIQTTDHIFITPFELASILGTMGDAIAKCENILQICRTRGLTTPPAFTQDAPEFGPHPGFTTN